MKDANEILRRVRDKYYDKPQDECRTNESRDPCAQYRNAKFQVKRHLFSSLDDKKCCPNLSPISEEKPKHRYFRNTNLDSCFHKAFYEDIPRIENSSNRFSKPPYSNCDAHAQGSKALQRRNINISKPISNFYLQQEQMMKQNFPTTTRPQCFDSSRIHIEPNCSKCNVNNECLLDDSKIEMMKLKKQVELAKLDVEHKQKRIEDIRIRLEKVYRDLECNN